MKRLLFAFVLLVSFLAAQMNRGTINGTVSDASGGAVPVAKVTIRNTATNAVTRTETTSAGQVTSVSGNRGIKFGLRLDS